MTHWLYDIFVGAIANLEAGWSQSRAQTALCEQLRGPLREALPGRDAPPDGLERLARSMVAACLVVVERNLSKSLVTRTPEHNPYWTAFRLLFGLDLRMAVLLDRQPPRRFLVIGETGTGKEGVAAMLKTGLTSLEGGSSSESLSAVEFTQDLLQAELFGAVRGAYTGQVQARKGVLEALGNRGVLFLDELGKTSLTFQAQLLRVLESGQARKVGADSATELGRQHLVAATSLSLDALREPERFRPDLLHRFGGGLIRLPPLRVVIPRERSEALHFYERVVEQEIVELGGDMSQAHRQVWGLQNLGPPIARALNREAAGYAWPGNLRQLRSVIQRALMEGADRVGELMDEQRVLHPGSGDRPTSSGQAKLVGGLRAHLEAEERRCYAVAVGQARTLQDVARALDITRQTADRRLKHFELRDRLSARKAGSA